MAVTSFLKFSSQICKTYALQIVVARFIGRRDESPSYGFSPACGGIKGGIKMNRRTTGSPLLAGELEGVQFNAAQNFERSTA